MWGGVWGKDVQLDNQRMQVVQEIDILWHPTKRTKAFFEGDQNQHAGIEKERLSDISTAVKGE